MYSVAFDKIVAYQVRLVWIPKYDDLESYVGVKFTLFNLCAGVKPCKSSSPFISSSSSSCFDITRRLGTESLSSAILSFRLLR